MTFSHLHNLRNGRGHGLAQVIRINQENYHQAERFESVILRSGILNNGNPNNGYRNYQNSSKNHRQGGKVRLPDGGFRAGRPYIKQFQRKSKDGETYNFKFSIYKETNYLDDGNGGVTGFGYFIHIDDAPNLSFALNNLHTFHIIRCTSECHICWNKLIESFDEANAVMLVWTNRYDKAMDEAKKNRQFDDRNFHTRSKARGNLPAGTFRSVKKNKHSKRRRGGSHKMITVQMKQSIYDEIMSTLGKERPELGGMLGFREDQQKIDSYVFDEGARVTSVEYNPSIAFLQKIPDEDGDKEGIQLAGFVHSHPGYYDHLSPADIEYAGRIIDAFDLPYLFMPIVLSSYDSVSKMKGYLVLPSGKVISCLVKPYTEKKREPEEAENEDKVDPELLAKVEAGFDALEEKYSERQCEDVNKLQELHDTTCDRISDAVNLDYLRGCTIIGVEAGGARSFYEEMARIGVGKFFIIDGDASSYSNIASQNGRLSEVGIAKPETVKSRIADINPEAEVKNFDFNLDDAHDDAWFEKEIHAGLDPKKTFICAFTDSFFAQARASKLARKYSIPYLSGQHYAGGKCSETIFWYPVVTAYTEREILSSRYEAYQNGYRNDVTSKGAPIFVNVRLNVLCEKLALGMLLYSDSPDGIYSQFLKRCPDRNIILIRESYLSPLDHLSDLFLDSPEAQFDDAVWLKVEDFVDSESTPKEDGPILDSRDIFGEKEEAESYEIPIEDGSALEKAAASLKKES